MKGSFKPALRLSYNTLARLKSLRKCNVERKGAHINDESSKSGVCFEAMLWLFYWCLF